MEDYPIYELNLENINFDGMKAISIVEFPAIEEDFMKFSKIEDIKLSELNTEKRIITGPALIPDKLIYRKDESRGKYYVKFSADTIVKLSENFLKKFKQQNINIEHEIEVNDVTVIESWIVKNSENDKSNELGFNIPTGTWMISMKIDNDVIWDKIKSGDLKGFSIEALLSNHLVENSIEMDVIELEEEKLLTKINNIDYSTISDSDLNKIVEEINNILKEI